MIVTEKEAGSIACPFAHSFNGHIEPRAFCLGSMCMQWNQVDPEWEYMHDHLPGILSPEEILAQPARDGGEHWISFAGKPMNFRQQPATPWIAGSTAQTYFSIRRLKVDRRGQCGRSIVVGD